MLIQICRVGLAAAMVSALLCLAPSHVSAQDSLETLGQELVRMRGEVESLNADLNRVQEQHRAEMNSLAAQKGDLEATRRREDLRIRQLEQDLAENRERAQSAGAAGESLIPVAIDAIDQLQNHIQTGLPFKIDERLDALAELRNQLESAALAPPRVINRVWSFYEDELRLTRENALYSQIIPLQGDRVLADIAKLGTVAMYFQTRDGRVGQTVRNGQDWQFVTIEERVDQQQVEVLFDSLQKQIRTGFFELPNGSIQLESGE